MVSGYTGMIESCFNV